MIILFMILLVIFSLLPLGCGHTEYAFTGRKTVPYAVRGRPQGSSNSLRSPCRETHIPKVAVLDVFSGTVLGLDPFLSFRLHIGPSDV